MLKKHQKQKLKNKIHYKDIALAIILAINEGDITYREFKKAQTIIDEKFWKPKWAEDPKIR